MRKVLEPQMELGELPIGMIELDPRSRDDIPQILRGLQHLYTTPEVRAEVFAILEELVPERSTETGPEKVDVENGRPGMSQWNLLVLGVLRLGLNADYDRIRELANEHKTIRQFLGHSGWDDDTSYGLQTLRDNLTRFTPEVLDRINQVVVRAGHRALKKSLEDGLVGRCDSFVVETDVHYPTDTNLLLDAIRKVIGLSAELAAANDRTEWRQHAYHQRQFKQDRFPRLHAVSMDKGFHSPSNQTALRQLVDTVVLPKKGRCNRAEAEREADPTFAALRRTHAAVESAINALEVHGLDRCRDHGIDGFRRYVGLAVLARNIQHVGAILRRQERDAEKRRRGPYRKAA